MVDTNVYIAAFRSEERNAALREVHAAYGPWEFLSSIVEQELRAGARSDVDRRRLERSVLQRFWGARRVVPPSARTWQQSGGVLATLRDDDGLGVSRTPKSFGNDILLALSCREHGMVLLTDNERDFARIARIAPFDYVTG
jgi:predicted nucleic acid-binding protein